MQMSRNWMLGARGQRWLKGLHVTCVAFSLGGALSILILLVLKKHLNGSNLFLIDLSIYRLFSTAVNYSFYGILSTGFIYSLFTKWGFFRHYWITIKWAVVLLLFAFTWLWVGPAINGMVALADGGFVLPGTQAEYFSYSRKSFPFCLIEVLLFVCLVFISVLKPWGMRKPKLNMSRKLVLAISGTLIAILIAFLAMNSLMLQSFRKIKVENSDLSALANGTYRGKATFGGFTYEVEVIVVEHRIKEIKIIQNQRSSYARFAEGVIPKIIKAQNANIDTITGATTTSKCLIKAVEDALKK